MSELNIPETWAETTWKEIMDIQGGSQPPKSTFSEQPKKNYIRLLQIRDFASDKNIVYIPEEKAKRTCNEDDILIGRYGASVGRICTGKSGAYNVALAKVIYPKEYISKGLLEFYLKAPDFQHFIVNLGGRAAQAGFNKDDLANLKFPIPPIKEQERIVQRIESCFEKIDETEQNLNQVETLLSKYRESLFTKAFEGRLLKKASKVEVEYVSFEEGPLQILDGDRGKNYPKKEDYLESGYCLFLNASNVTKTGFVFDEVSFISKEKDNALRKGKIERNDVVVTTRGTLGNVAYYDESIPFEHIRINSGMVILRVDRKKLSPRYLKAFIQSPLFLSQVKKLKSGSAQPQLPIKDMKKIELPLPDISEQEEIVGIVEELLMKLSDVEKEAKIRKKLISKLRDSVLVKAFEGRLVEQIPSEGTGKELLEQILKEKEVSSPAKKVKKRSKKKQ